MPKLSVYFIRAALIHLMIGFLMGGLLLTQKGVPIGVWVWRLRPAHIDLMILGWTLQLIMGVAFFALPRFSPPASRYGATALGWWSLILLNSGLVISAITETLVIRLIGKAAIGLAISCYLLMIWPRVKPLSISSSSTKTQDKGNLNS
jgi:cbb3-type cytochrome oxidase subunit 1